MTMGYKNAFFLIFDIYYVALKIIIYVMSYTWYAPLVKFLLRFELIKALFSLSSLIWDTSTPISNSAVFQHTVLDPLKQSRFDFSNPKQTFVQIQLLEIDYGRFVFSDSFVPDASKTSGTLFPHYRWLKTPEV